jgi:hypothetical protein
MIMENVIPTIELRNDIIHGSEIDIPKDKAGKVIEDVAYIWNLFMKSSRIFRLTIVPIIT